MNRPSPSAAARRACRRGGGYSFPLGRRGGGCRNCHWDGLFLCTMSKPAHFLLQTLQPISQSLDLSGSNQRQDGKDNGAAQDGQDKTDNDHCPDDLKEIRHGLDSSPRARDGLLLGRWSWGGGTPDVMVKRCWEVSNWLICLLFPKNTVQSSYPSHLCGNCKPLVEAENLPWKTGATRKK